MRFLCCLRAAVTRDSTISGLGHGAPWVMAASMNPLPAFTKVPMFFQRPSMCRFLHFYIYLRVTIIRNFVAFGFAKCNFVAISCEKIHMSLLGVPARRAIPTLMHWTFAKPKTSPFPNPSNTAPIYKLDIVLALNMCYLNFWKGQLALLIQ